MQEYLVFCRRADRLTLDDVVRLGPPAMKVRPADVLEGFVVDAPDLAIGIFVCKEEKLAWRRELYTDDPAEIPPRADNLAERFTTPIKYLVPSAVLERLRASPLALDVSFLRGRSDDPRAKAFVASLLAHVDGCMDTGLGRIRDAQGDALSLGPPELRLVPPEEDRVVRRASCLAAMAMRSHLEEGPAEEVGPLLERVRRWMQVSGADAELEPHERALLDAPLGKLAPEERATASWQAEGLGALAWAFGVADLPPFDVPTSPAEVAARFAFLVEPVTPFTAHLRDAEERASMCDRVFAVHWRLNEFLLSREAIDFRSVAKKAWFGPLDLSGLPLVRTGGLLRPRLDLAVKGKPLTAASERDLGLCLRIAEERHRALTWLVAGGTYSAIDISA